MDPPTTAFIIRERLSAGEPGKPKSVQYRWVDGEQISPYIKVAVIASEDQKFPEHYGFDLDSINDALEDRERGRRVRGASTLTQQVAKNLFLWPGQSWIRKGLEAYFTVLIETLWPKQRILEVYVNIAEFGSGVFGVGAAAEIFFKKPAARLSAPGGCLAGGSAAESETDEGQIAVALCAVTPAMDSGTDARPGRRRTCCSRSSRHRQASKGKRRQI